MSKLFKAYSRGKGIDKSSLHFLIDGERIQETDTPLSLELEEDDQIDAVRIIELNVRDDSGEVTIFKVRSSVQMSKVFEVYASRKGVDESSLQFSLNGVNIQGSDTPLSLQLTDNDQIDVNQRTIEILIKDKSGKIS